MSHSSSPSPSLTDARFHCPDCQVLYVPRTRETGWGVLQHILVCWHVCWGIYLPPHLLALLSPVSLSSLLFFFSFTFFPTPFLMIPGLLSLSSSQCPSASSSAPGCFLSKPLPSYTSLPKMTSPRGDLARSPDAWMKELRVEVILRFSGHAFGFHTYSLQFCLTVSCHPATQSSLARHHGMLLSKSCVRRKGSAAPSAFLQILLNNK